MFNVESLIPKICQLGQEVGRDEKGLCLRSAALQALASMVLLPVDSYIRETIFICSQFYFVAIIFT